MSLEAMQYLAAEEERVRQMKAAAAAAAKKRIAETRAAGEAMLEEAEARARRELAELNSASEKEAGASARSLAEETGSRRAAMRAAAEGKMPEAVSFIVERIVKS